MIDARSRSREWILESCQQNNVNDPTLMEKGINTINRYDPSVDLRGERLESPVHPAINKVKILRPKAFWYWREIERLIKTKQ